MSGKPPIDENVDDSVAVFDSLKLGRWTWNVLTGVQVWSDRNYQIFGLTKSADSTSGSRDELLKIVHPDDLHKLQADILGVKSSEPCGYLFRIIRPDGEIRHVQTCYSVDLDDEGIPYRVVGTSQDVTDSIRAQEELRLAMDQIIDFEKLQSLARVVAGVAHELNTPIGNILMTSSSLTGRILEFTKTMEAGNLSRTGLHALIVDCKRGNELIERSAHRANELIESFKRVSVDQASRRRRKFDLRLTIDDMINTMAGAIRLADVAIEMQIPADIELDSYPGELEQIFNNLITNSIKHGFENKKGGRILIQGKLHNGIVEIFYEDDGAGIAKELHRHLFDPFFTTKFGHGGSGLGLFIVHNLVYGVFRGCCVLDSAIGKGFRLHLKLPAALPE